MPNKFISSLSKGARVCGKAISDHAPMICTCVGVAGVISTSYLFSTASIKAYDIYLQKLVEQPKTDVLNERKKAAVEETLKIGWRLFIPATASGVIAIAAIVYSNRLSNKRGAALASLYAVSEKALKEYQSKVIETVGEKTNREIKDSIAKDRIDDSPINDTEIYITGNGNTLCHDSYTGQYFRSDIEVIRRAVNTINERIIREVYVSLNEFQEEIGLGWTKCGDYVGWNSDQLMEVDYSSQLTPSGTPCLCIDYSVVPKHNYDVMF